ASLIVLAFVCDVFAFPVANLMHNPSFESLAALSASEATAFCAGSIFGGSALQCNSSIQPRLAPWGMTGVIDVLSSGFVGIPCSDGAFCLDMIALLSDPLPYLTQTLSLTPGQSYRLFLDLGAIAPTCGCSDPTPPRILSVVFSSLSGAATY